MIRCKCWCVGASLALMGLTVAGAWAVLRTPPTPVVTDPQAEAVPHAQASQVLAGALERLHQEALTHFHADPKNGYLRMPPVFEKVVKEWKTPWFSSGELDRDEPIPFAKDMERIHQDSVKNFLAPRTLLPEGQNQLFAIARADGAKYDQKKKVWEAKSIDLIGLVKHPTPVVYVSEKTALADFKDQPPMRPLDEFEFGGLQALQKGQDLFGRSRDNVIRLLGAVRAETSCVTCHRDKKEGDLLGAFSYVLREAEYAGRGFGKARIPNAAKK